MSLLMDALKKAELAKRQGQSESAGESTQTDTLNGLTLEPIPGTSPPSPAAPSPATDNLASPDILPHLPSHLEDLDAQFLAEAKQAASARLKPPLPQVPAREPATPQPSVETAPRPAPTRTRPPAPEPSIPQSQSAAQNVFAAKQADKPPARKAFAIAVGVLTVLSVCGIGGYFWWQLQPKSMLVANRTAPPPPVSAVSAPLPVPPPIPAGPVAAPIAPGLGAASATAPPRPAASAGDDGDDDAPPTATARAAPARRSVAAPVAPPEQEAPIRVSRTPLKVNPALTRGFDAFNRGDLASAQNEYERAQKSDPRNTDALHGLAAVAVRQGRLDQAELFYRRITEADPQDTVAASALINMRAQIDPHAAESRLKSMSAAQPELAAPHFSLGNLYARDGRWSDAQQAYFRAFSAEPDNPDILYNLAISLEHLRQNKLAAQYYAQAIAAAQNRPAGFDKAQASTRLRTLQP